MSGETGIGEMTAEQTKKAERINSKLNVIFLEIKKNLDIISKINSIMLGADLRKEVEPSEKPVTNGWFDEVIEVLETIDIDNTKLEDELLRLRAEFK